MEAVREAGPVHVGHQMWQTLTLDAIVMAGIWFTALQQAMPPTGVPRVAGLPARPSPPGAPRLLSPPGRVVALAE